MRGGPGWSPTSVVLMAFRLEFSAEAERDFGLIFDHLLRSYLEFGEVMRSGPCRSAYPPGITKP